MGVTADNEAGFAVTWAPLRHALTVLTPTQNHTVFAMAHRIVKVGLIGCGEVAQVVHIPTLGFLHDRFLITYLCDVSAQSMDFCARRVVGPAPKTTFDAADLCASPDVDVVFVINSSEYHAEHTVLALKHGKHVFLEKPAALNLRDIQTIKDAEMASPGKVMVGYMRRYAGAFVDAVKEVGGLDKILYARVRGESTRII